MTPRVAEQGYGRRSSDQSAAVSRGRHPRPHPIAAAEACAHLKPHPIPPVERPGPSPHPSVAVERRGRLTPHLSAEFRPVSRATRPRSGHHAGRWSWNRDVQHGGRLPACRIRFDPGSTADRCQNGRPGRGRRRCS
jgi:hypothetical protein